MPESNMQPIFVDAVLQVLHMDTRSTGFATALPYVLSAILKV